ncbi:MAG: helix-turn-helix transcriptional regulator, partial [Clostridia bacterium]
MIEQIELRQIIASNLIRLRKVSGLTQAELAQKINYTDKSVSKWERGEGAPDIFVLNQLAEIYKVTVNDIIGVKKVTPNRNKVQFNTIVAMLSSS